MWPPVVTEHSRKYQLVSQVAVVVEGAESGQGGSAPSAPPSTCSRFPLRVAARRRARPRVRLHQCTGRPLTPSGSPRGQWTNNPPTPDTHNTHTHALPPAAGARRSVASFSCSSVTHCQLTNESRSICSELLSSYSSSFFGHHEAVQLRLFVQRKVSVRPSVHPSFRLSVRPSVFL